MKPLQLPNEAARLEALRRYKILDTPSEQAFDEITLLAAHVCITPIARIAFVDADRVWFKSKVGLTTTEVPREIPLCASLPSSATSVTAPRKRRGREPGALESTITDFAFLRALCGFAVELSPQRRKSRQAIAKPHWR
jgi:hypothetical protein